MCIDLVIEWGGGRTDYLCEMKFSLSQFVIDNEYEEILQERIDHIYGLLKDDNVRIHLTFITVKGVKPNMHSGIVQKEVLLKDILK